jgi:hypothetical protein
VKKDKKYFLYRKFILSLSPLVPKRGCDLQKREKPGFLPAQLPEALLFLFLFCCLLFPPHLPAISSIHTLITYTQVGEEKKKTFIYCKKIEGQ